MASIKQFKNGRIRDPVAQRVERKRLNRLRAIKSSVKSRGLNRSQRAATRRLDKRGGNNNRRRGLKDITNNNSHSNDDDNKWKSLHNSANDLLKRAQKHAATNKKIQRLQDEFDDGNASETDVLDASFDTLWNFHAQKNGMPQAGATNELQDHDDGALVDATSLIAPLGTARSEKSEKYTARSVRSAQSTKSSKSIKLDDEAAQAFQNAWSAATPFNLHDDALNDSRVEGDHMSNVSNGLFGREKKSRHHGTTSSHGGKSRSKKGRNPQATTSRGALGNTSLGRGRPNLNKMEKEWESRGLPTWSKTVAQNNGNNGNNGTTGNMDNINNTNNTTDRNRQQSPETNVGASNPLQFDLLNVKRRTDDGTDILTQLADVGGDGDGVMDGYEDDSDSIDNDMRSNNKSLALSKSRTNLFRSASVPVASKPLPHYGTRTKTSMNKTLKPIHSGNGESTRDEQEKQLEKNRGSWRGGGAADPHAQIERERVLEVKKREQKQAREQARKWRKRRQVQHKKEEAKKGLTDKKENLSAPLPASAPTTMAVQKGNTIKALKNEAEEAQAMLAEVMNNVADVTLAGESVQHTHRSGTCDDSAEKDVAENNLENSMIPTPIKNSQKFAYMNKDLHLDSPSEDQEDHEDSPFLQRESTTSEEAPESNTPPAAEPPHGDDAVDTLYSIPKLDLNGVEPDVSEDDDDEDEPLFE